MKAYDAYKTLAELEVEGAPAEDKRYKDLGVSNGFIITNAYKGHVYCYNERSQKSSSGNQADDPDLVETIGDFKSLVRKTFSEIWIFEEIETNSSGIGTFESKLPDTITSWDVSGFTISKNYGLGIAKPQSVVVAQKFFLMVHLPYSIRIGEILRVDVTVFNYFGTKVPFEVDVTLYSEAEMSADIVNANNDEVGDDGDQPDFDETTTILPMLAVKVESGFIFQKPNKNSEGCHYSELINETKKKMATNRIAIPAKTGVLTSFFIKASIAGDREFKIRAQGVKAKNTFDEVIKTLKVEQDGIMKDKNEPKLFDLRFNKSSNNGVQIDVQIPDEAIKNSIRIEALVIGELIGPALNSTKNLM